ncbi:hypothetical protein KDW75_gp38 [Mycobacterium phage Mercurio]|uniref:Uncharacterized protein n=1 Tax=Mycobacterium phage Mercurio TaxID=2575612 RepID=A0A5J6T9J8_9CAUD|nr:hypothetical protein KDW75_gp38 [Mycobacterium phage Mercurio]QFG06040.1 hypothetical protein PBI_MERCURIO_38 [Mycobacterium phage Mercurio]
MTVWLITAALFALAIALLADPRRGRHHIHARLLARPFERRRLTVAELEARLDAEARRPRLVPVGTGYVSIDVKTTGFDEELARVLFELQDERARVTIPEGATRLDVALIGAGGTGRGLVDGTAGIGG